MVKKGALTQKIHWLTQTLILSGVLNVIFIGIFFYFLVRENPFPIAFEYTPVLIQQEEVLIPAEIVKTFLPLSRYQLIEKLKNEQLVEDGYRVRDFALSLLVYREHIDLRRALGVKSLSERRWKIGAKHELILFPGLEKNDFDKIEAFLREEAWPQTSFGLYCLIKKQLTSSDPTLLQTFCQTPEFLALETLFGRSGLPIKKGAILALACESDWSEIEKHLNMQKENCNFHEKRRQEFLLHALESHSKTAAYLCLITDFPFASKQLDDAHVCLLLDLLAQGTHEAIRYAKEIAVSQRSDQIRQKAFRKLVDFGVARNEPLAARLEARPGAIGELRPVFREAPPASPPTSTHLVQPGESLWIIARKYKISIEDLMAKNGLSSQTIRPGQALKIP